jgi:DNA-binding NarL/FixJ family response regulator
MKDCILYVDDDAENLRTFAFLFKNKYCICTASTGLEALEYFKTHKVKVILSDQRMPGMTGVELLEQVHNNYPDTIRILVSAYSDIEAVINSINKGCVYRYIHKPWIVKELEAIIDNAVRLYDIEMDRKDLIKQLQNRNELLEQRVKEQTEEIRAVYDSKIKSIEVAQMMIRDGLNYLNNLYNDYNNGNDLISKVEYQVLCDRNSLTLREREILTLIIDGSKNEQIAKQLNLSESTVMKHRQNLYDKLGVHNRDELMKLISIR